MANRNTELRNQELARIDQALERGELTPYEARQQEAACEAQFPYLDGETSYQIPQS